MSVTLRLADQDASLVGELLELVAKERRAVLDRQPIEPVRHAMAIGRLVGSFTVVKRVEELAGTFSTAVRANQR